MDDAVRRIDVDAGRGHSVAGGTPAQWELRRALDGQKGKMWH